jgi:hypothetical protein
VTSVTRPQARHQPGLQRSPGTHREALSGRHKTIAFTCVRSLGIPADEYSIPYLASWAQSAELDTIQRTAGLIDRLASRIETTLHSDPTDSVDEHPADTVDAKELEAVTG